jgi:hypothetical protein
LVEKKKMILKEMEESYIKKCRERGENPIVFE